MPGRKSLLIAATAVGLCAAMLWNSRTAGAENTTPARTKEPPLRIDPA
jgi:hypothetical protein